MAEQVPVPPVKQRGRPKRLQGAQCLRVLTPGVPEELLRRLDAYTAAVQAAQPYLRLSRADVLRLLLDQGLPTASGRAQDNRLLMIGIEHDHEGCLLLSLRELPWSQGLTVLSPQPRRCHTSPSFARWGAITTSSIPLLWMRCRQAAE